MTTCQRAMLLVLVVSLWALPGFAQKSPSGPVVPEIAAPAPDPNVLGENVADWQARLELARLYSYLKKFPEAVEEYDKALREKPDLLVARLEMARVLSWMGKTDKAKSILEGVGETVLSPSEKLLFADILAAGKDYTGAERLYREHLVGNPDDASVRLRLADVLSWMHRYDQSLEQYRILLKAVPNDIQVRRKYAYVLMWSGRHEEAARELRTTLAQ